MRKVKSLFGPVWAGSGVGAVAALTAQLAWGQLVPPLPTPSVPTPGPNVVEGATDTVQGAVQSATDTAQDAASTATSTTQDAASTAADTAQDTAKTATSTAQDTAKSATSTAQDTAKTATSTAQDTAKSATSTAQDTAKSATSTARDATKSATDTARDTAKSATGTARDATKSATDTARDATDAARSTTRSATDAARRATSDAADTARETGRDAANTADDTERSATDSARDVRGTARDTVRDTRDTTRDAARDVRGTARDSVDDVRDTVRDTARDLRGTAQDAARDVRGTVRESIRDSRISARATTDYRAADLGLWFNRSGGNGLIIADVAADAAFGRFGFVEGDRIVSVGGQTVATEADFIRYIMNPRLNDRVNVVVMRGGRQQVLYVDPIVVREHVMTVHVDPLEQFGVILDDRYDDRLVVWRVIPRSPAFYAGIRAGDVITTFAGQRIASPSALVQVVQRIDPGMVAIQVNRNGQARTIEADFPDLQVSGHTSARQNLDVDVNARGGRNEASIRSDVEGAIQPDQDVRVRANAQGELDAEPAIPADAPPVIENRRPAGNPGYNNNNNAPQRRSGGIFRRR